MEIHAGTWSAERPSILVIACSDGRMEQQTDAFLKSHLGISGYDRLYIPGGPGALTGSNYEYSRADQHRRECRFLVEAHQVKEVILIFHGNSADGPHEAMCADYSRKLPGKTNAELLAQQEADAKELLQTVFTWPPDLRIRVFRGEVLPSHEVQFVELARR